VTAALVNRYFGTKEELFREAIDTEDPGPRGLAGLDRAQFGALLAPTMVAGHVEPEQEGVADPSADGADGHSSFDSILMLLNSASSPAAQPILRDHLESTVMPGLIEYFGNDAVARKRAVLVLSLALGNTLLGPILGIEPLTGVSGSSDADTVAITAAMLQAAADAPVAEGSVMEQPDAGVDSCDSEFATGSCHLIRSD
jgi:AcrR family transcriptional regulator